jgi:hypothetical protein
LPDITKYFPNCPKSLYNEKGLVDFLAVCATRLRNELGSIVDGAEGADCCVDTLDHQQTRDDDPEGVHEDEVSPVVGGLRARVCDVEDVMVEHGGCVVKNVAIELAERDDELERVAEGVVVGDETGGDEGEGTPEGLSLIVSNKYTREKGR